MRLILFLSIILFSFLGMEDLSAQTGSLATDGMYVPRMTTATRNAIINPGNGQMIYNTDDDCFNIYQKKFWEKLCGLDVTISEAWIQKANLGGIARNDAVGFSIGNKGYIGTGFRGFSNAYFNDFWEYYPAANVWTQKADFAGTARYRAVGFSIGNKGYVGTGTDGSLKKDFWEYDPANNIWTQKTNFGGTARNGAVGFSIGSKGYIGTGVDVNSYTNDFWEYDPATNAWTQKTNFGGDVRYRAVGFSISSKGYIGTGRGNTFFNDFWEYNPANNTWAQKANVTGNSRYGAVGFSIGNKGYIGTGISSGIYTNDFWEYEPVTNSWAQKVNAGGSVRSYDVGFSVGSKGYIGTGDNINVYKNDFWEFNLNSANITEQGNVFNGDNQLVKLDALGNLAINGGLNISGNIGNQSFVSSTLLNGWVNYDVANGYAAAGYFKDKQSVVHLKGLIKNGVTTSFTVLFNLPVGYQPTANTIFMVVNSSTFGIITITPNGDVQIYSGGNSFLSLDGISFRAN